MIRKDNLMTDKQFVKTYKQERFETTSSSVLAEDHGFRLRQTARTKQAGPDIWELATTYFYTNQNSTLRALHELQTLAERENMVIMVIKVGYYGQRIGAILNPTKDHIQFDTKPWPKSSWASLFISISSK